MQKIQNIIRRFFTKKISFKKLRRQERIYLYAGDVPNEPQYHEYIGLSLYQSNANHISHNILKPYPLPDNSIDRYQSEDVFEHIQYNELPNIINEIYRILKPNGYFRLSVPDYQCDVLIQRSQKDEDGRIIFDPGGGGAFINGQVVCGGHVWFPTYLQVKKLLTQSNFTNINFMHYYDENGLGVTNQIDYAKGYVKRTPDHDQRVQSPYRPMSIVVDCVK